MLRIGLTGGIGAGKSIIAQVLSIMGFPVFYSDQAAKSMMENDSAVIDKIKNAFGDEAYDNGKLNRKHLADQIFAHDQLRETLNAIVHPAVRKRFHEWCQVQETEIVFNEAAIIFETGTYTTYDATILVTAPEQLRIQRVMQRDSTTKEAVKARINKQWSFDRKSKLADYVIHNDDIQLVVPQIEKVVSQLLGD